MKDKNKSNSQFNIEQINAQYGKLPPQAVEVEEAVLGQVMIERNAIHKIIPIISAEAFYKEEHQIIFNTVQSLSSNGKAIDLITVVQQLKDNDLLDKVGGPGYIAKLTSRVASAAHIEYHARIISDKFMQREMIRRFSEIVTKAYEDDYDELEMMYTMHTQAIDNMMAGNSGMQHIAQILKDTTADLEARQIAAKNGETPGIPTGLLDLDHRTQGWQPGDLIIVAARPSMGKTAIALNLFGKAAAMHNKNICIFSLEMENIKLSQRLILSYGGVERDNMKSGRMTEGDWHAYNQAMSDLEQLPIFIDDTAGVNLRYLEAVIRNKSRKGECDAVIIDYLQLVESPAEYGKNREREVAEISRGLKKIAKSTNVPIILLAQLNRALESRPDKTPRLADLRESGSIEQDADIVMFPWRPCYYDKDAQTEQGESLQGVMVLEIAKNRDGRTGPLWAKHNTDLTEFYDFNTYNQQETRDWTN